MTARAVCVELGGGGAQTIVFEADGRTTFHDGARNEDGPLLVAVPGIVKGDRVVAASNLGWYDVDPVRELGLRGPADVVANDAEAAALGESVLRGLVDLAYMGLGTGIGGAIVLEGRVAQTEVFGHRTGYSDLPCPCGRVGCLETVAAGWALPSPVPAEKIPEVASALATALEDPSLPNLVVVAGGLAADNPAIVEELRARVARRTIETSRAPAEAKSAAAWGLLRLAGLDAGLTA
jgi:predicted NBD/HSP70 family sugar kinase